MKKAGLEIARTKIMLCDAAKIGRDSFRIFARVNDVDTLIVDNEITDQNLKDLRKQKVKLIIAKP